jgi:hypothetical protein
MGIKLPKVEREVIELSSEDIDPELQSLDDSAPDEI